MMIAGGYKGYVLRMRRDKNTRIIEIFGPACSDFALSTATTVAEAKRWIDDYIDLEQTIADLVDRKKGLDIDSPEYQLINRMLTKAALLSRGRRRHHRGSRPVRVGRYMSSS